MYRELLLARDSISSESFTIAVEFVRRSEKIFSRFINRSQDHLAILLHTVPGVILVMVAIKTLTTSTLLQ